MLSLSSFLRAMMLDALFFCPHLLHCDNFRCENGVFEGIAGKIGVPLF